MSFFHSALAEFGEGGGNSHELETRRWTRMDGGEIPAWELDISTGRDAPYKIVTKASVLFGKIPP